MNCLACKTKECKLSAKDCSGLRDETIDYYKKSGAHSIYSSADKLVSGGRAGSLSRLEEIVEYCVLSGIKKAAVAYCYSMENLALETAEHLRSAGISISSYRCTIGGIKENDIDDSLGASVNCNPAGQAASINKENADLVIEMGLCLGHDIIFHEALKVPHTVFLVKDRVFNGNPARALASYRDSADKFIESLDSSFNMRSAEWLNGRLLSDDPPVIIDLRSPEAFAEASIKGSVNILLKQLPEKYMTLNDVRGRDIICLCNGSVQSAYAAGYLFTRGFKKVYNLSGGFRKFADSFSGFIVSGGRSA